MAFGGGQHSWHLPGRGLGCYETPTKHRTTHNQETPSPKCQQWPRNPSLCEGNADLRTQNSLRGTQCPKVLCMLVGTGDWRTSLFLICGSERGPSEGTVTPPHPAPHGEPVGGSALICHVSAVVRTHTQHTHTGHVHTGRIPGKGDLVTFAVSEFGKTFLTLKKEKSSFELFAGITVLLWICWGRCKPEPESVPLSDCTPGARRHSPALHSSFPPPPPTIS